MKMVAILYVCTGKYDVFWRDFYLSAEKYFLVDCEKFYYVFTDSKHIFREENDHIIKTYQPDLGWPDNTLMRFHIFDSQRKSLEKYDYLFFLNANCLFADEITSDEFLPEETDFLFVSHPIFYNKSNLKYTYERNPDSQAYIPMGEGTYYICGGVNGGKARPFLQLIAVLKNRVDVDKEAGIIAVWHDESHINKYAYENENFKLLDASYFFPEGWNGAFSPKIIVREKSKYFDVDTLKKHKISLRHKVKHLLRRLTGIMIRL